MMYQDHDLSLVEDKYRHIVSVLLECEDMLSDGYKYYCEFFASEQAHEKYNDDIVIAALVEIAKDILGEENEDSN